MSEQLSFYPFIQGMMDIEVDPFNLKSWLVRLKSGFELGEGLMTWVSRTHGTGKVWTQLLLNKREAEKNQTNLAKYLNNDHIHRQIFWTKKLQNKHTVLEQKLKKDIDAFKKGRRLVAKKLKTHF